MPVFRQISLQSRLRIVCKEVTCDLHSGVPVPWSMPACWVSEDLSASVIDWVGQGPVPNEVDLLPWPSSSLGTFLLDLRRAHSPLLGDELSWRVHVITPCVHVLYTLAGHPHRLLLLSCFFTMVVISWNFYVLVCPPLPDLGSNILFPPQKALVWPPSVKSAFPSCLVSLTLLTCSINALLQSIMILIISHLTVFSFP